MAYAPGFIYGLGVVSGLVLAGIAFLIYLALKTPEVTDEAELEAAVERTEALTARLAASTSKVQNASTTISGIEPGE